jgi:sugar phosphate isomerase/epimerase
MPQYSLAAALFIYDKDAKTTGDHFAALEQIAAAGFREVELTAEGPLWAESTRPDSEPFRKKLDSLGVFPHTIHTPLIGVNLAAADESARKDAVHRIAESIRFLGELGGKTAIVHPSNRPAENEPPYAWGNLGAMTEIAYRSVSELIPVAEKSGVRIALENLTTWNIECRPVISMQELRALIAGFPHERVGLCLDTGHARMTGLDPAQQARIAGERLIALHIQDIDGENDCHWVPGDGVVDFSSLGAALTEIDFDGAWTIEVLSMKTDLTAEQVASKASVVRERWEKDGMGNL